MRLINEVQGNFTIVPNYILQQRTISLKAIGLYCKLSSLPTNWRFTEEGLFSIVKDGKDSTKTALKELETLGLFYKFQSRDEKGRTGETIFYLSPTPMTEEEKQEIRSRFKPLEIIKASQIIGNTEFEPSAENPLSDKLLTENLIQYNINEYNIQKYNIEKEKINKKEKDFSSEFEQLWKLYPKKEGKQVALKTYITCRKNNETTFEEVKEGILKYIKQIEKNKTTYQYIKQGSTWFNQRRWTDVYDISSTVKDVKQEISDEQRDVMSRLI